jgi:hypothetical protein
MKYKVIKKVNGKFAPRIVNTFTGEFGCWFEIPAEFDKIEDAISALKKEKAKNILSEEIVFELK